MTKGKIFTKEFKKNLISYAKAYYQANKEKLVKNEYFEYCVKLDSESSERLSREWRCNTCEYKEVCGKGGEYFEENPNIIGQLAEEIIRCCENREISKGILKGEMK
jgi:hypothetical protein